MLKTLGFLQGSQVLIIAFHPSMLRIAGITVSE